MNNDLSSEIWCKTFDKILLPLLQDIKIMSSDTRIIVSNLFVKIFLHKLSSISKSEYFPELWLKILSQMVKGIKENDVSEIIVESLKNILYVMKYYYLFIIEMMKYYLQIHQYLKI